MSILFFLWVTLFLVIPNHTNFANDALRCTHENIINFLVIVNYNLRNRCRIMGYIEQLKIVAEKKIVIKNKVIGSLMS